MNICVPINQRIEDIAKKYNTAPRVIASIIGSWRSRDPEARYEVYPDDEYFEDYKPKDFKYVQSVEELIDLAEKKLNELNKDEKKYIVAFHGGQRFIKPNRKFQYTGEFRNPDIRRIAESMGARYEGEMLFYTPENYGNEIFYIQDAAYSAGRYAFDYGNETPTLYAYLIPVDKANFTDRGFGEVGLSYDDIDAGNYIEAGRINLESLKSKYEAIDIDIDKQEESIEQIITVAPYFRNRLTSQNKEQLEKKTQIVKDRANKLAEAIGLDIDHIVPVYGTYLGKSEISYQYIIKSNDQDTIDLFASLMGDLSFEYQDAVIAVNYVTRDQWNELSNENKALEIEIATPEDATIEEVENLLSKNNIDGSTYNFNNNKLNIIAFSQEEAENIISKILQSNETNERKFEPRGFTEQNSRYLDNDARRNIYEVWLNSDENRQNRKLYNACSKALEICKAAGRFDKPEQEQQRITAAKIASDNFDKTLKTRKVLSNNQIQTPGLSEDFNPTPSNESMIYNIFGTNLQVRIDMIARDFTSIMNKLRRQKLQEVQKTIEQSGETEQLKQALAILQQNNFEDRKTILNLIGGADIVLNSMIEQYNKFSQQGNNILTVKQDYVKSEYRKILDNFKQLYNAAQVEIEKINGIHTDIIDDVDIVDEDGRDGASGNEGWSVKWHMIDLHDTTSTITRGIISQIPRLSSDGKTKITDDLGNTVYMDENEVHKILVDILSEIEIPEDFCVYDKQQERYVSFPLLEKANKKYKWITPIISYLKSHPEHVDAFYADFRNDYFQYKTIKTVSDKMLQSNVTRLINLNERSAVESQLDQIQSNIKNGFPLNKEMSVYNSDGRLNKDNIVLLKKALEKFKIDSKNVTRSQDVTDGIVKDMQSILNAIGYPVNRNELKSVLKDSDDVYGTIQNVTSVISQMLANLAQQNNPDYRIYHKNRGFYEQIINQIGKINANLVAQTFRQNGNSYTSYTKPNFLSSTRKLIKGKHWSERLDFYKTDNTLTFNDNGINKFYFEWLNMFENNPEIRKQFDMFYVNQLDGVDYMDWTADDIYKKFTEFYFLEQKKGFGAYNSPILSDSPVSVFIQMPKFEDDLDGNFEDKMLPLFRNIVKFELARMRRVEDQNKAGSKNVANFNKQGLKFRFFPELNTLRGRDGRTFMEVYNEIKNGTNAEQGINSLIDSTLRFILDGISSQYIDNLKQNDVYQELRKDLVDNNIVSPNISQEAFERKLREFVWNNTFAEMNIVHLFGIDPAYTKSGTDFQKRWKQIYASGIRPNTAGKYGRKTQKAIYLADDVFRSKRYDDIKFICDQKILEGKITSFDRDCILNIFQQVNNSDAQALRSMNSYENIMRMVGKWNDVKDSFERLRNGQWDYSDFNKVYQTIKPFTYTLTQESDGLGGTQIVPHHNKNSEFLLLAMFNIINADLNKSERLKGMSRFMEESGIDVMMYESAVKLGCSGVISLNYSKNRVNDAVLDGYVEVDEKKFMIDVASFDSKKDYFENIMDQLYKKVDTGKMTQDEVNKAFEQFQMTADEVYNELISATGRRTSSNGEYEFNGTVHIQSMDDWGIITPTPEHFFDSVSVDGSQERNITPADLPDDFSITINGKTMNKWEYLRTYNDLYTEDYLCSLFGEIDQNTGKRKGGFMNLILDDNGDFNAKELSKKIKKLISDNPKYSRQLKEAIEVKPNGKTRMPFSSPQMYQLQELIFSQAKNKIITRKRKGASAILVSGIGMTDQLNVVYEYTDDSDKEISLQEAKKLGLTDTQIRLKGVECFLPASQKNIYRNYLKTAYRYSEVNGKMIKEKYVTLDYERLKKDCPESLKALGFRIPTENKYSITPLIIKGFLPEQNGSSIMVAADITALTGCDFDVDKMFLYFYETEFENYTDENGKARQRLRSIKYDPNADITTMTKAQRSNYLFDMKYGVMTHKDTLAQFQNPGNFEKLKIYSRISFLLQNKPLLNEFMAQQKKADTFEYLFKDLFKGNPKDTLKMLDDFISEHNPEKNICTVDTFVYNHEQNMAGSKLIGVYAVGGSQHTKYQNANIELIKPVNINGKKLRRLDDIYTQDGWLVSKQLAEFLAASVDNVKDPVLANMLQNLNTANFAIFLMRLGMNMEEVTLIFNNPYLRRLYKSDGSFSGLGNIISTMLRKVDFGGRNEKYIRAMLTPKSVTSKMLFDAQESEWPNNKVSVDTIMSVEQYRNTIGVLLFINDLLVDSAPISALTKISKFDSPKNAPSTLIDSMNNVINILRYNDNMEGYESIYQDLPTVDLLFGYNSDGEYHVNADYARRFSKGSFARINQSAFTFGYDIPLHLISEYIFTQNNFQVQSLLQDMGLEFSIPEDFYEKLMYYNLLDTELFGDDEQNTFAEKYNYYINEFPKKFIQIKNRNQDIAQIPVIQMMDVNNGRIILKRAGRLTQQDKDVLTRNFDQMLFSGNREQMQLAYDLFRYSFYREKLGIDHSAFGNLFSVQFIEQFPEYIEACNRIKDNSNSEGWLDQFKHYYEINHIDHFSKVIDIQKNPIKQGPNGSIIMKYKVDSPYITILPEESEYDFGDEPVSGRYYMKDTDVSPDQMGFVFIDITDEVRAIRKNEIYYPGSQSIRQVNETINSKIMFSDTSDDNQDEQNQNNTQVERTIKYRPDLTEMVEIKMEGSQSDEETVPLYQTDTRDNTDNNGQRFCVTELDMDFD